MFSYDRAANDHLGLDELFKESLLVQVNLGTVQGGGRFKIKRPNERVTGGLNLSVCFPVCVYLSNCLAIYLSTYSSKYLCQLVTIELSACPSIYLSICLCVHAMKMPL